MLVRARGMEAVVAPVKRGDWARKAASMMDADWWKGNLKPLPALDWCEGGLVEWALLTSCRALQKHLVAAFGPF